MRHHRRILMLALALPLLFAFGCSGSDDDTPTATATTTPPGTATADPTTVGDGFELIRADVDRATETDISATELESLVQGNTDFAFDLFLELAGDENTILSPYSVAAALTMTYAGSRGETAQEMRDTLSLGLPDGRLHAARNELDLRIAATPQPFEGDERQPFAIRIANSLWGHQGYPFLDEFLELLARDYDAGMNIVDFVNETEAARLAINGWVEERTEGRIVDLIAEGILTDLTRLVIVNAIWFKANWAMQFDPEMTEEATFATLSGDDVEVEMMHQSERLQYAERDGYAAVRLPYAGDAAMIVVLPNDGEFESVRDRFGAAELDALRGALSTFQVELGLPKFEFRSELGLKKALQELGIVRAFTEPSLPEGADLTGMTEIRELYVHDVVHQAFIAVDEVGTEAAAATAVIIGLESLPPPATFMADRPFLFVIEHASTGEALFIGQVVNPTN